MNEIFSWYNVLNAIFIFLLTGAIKYIFEFIKKRFTKFVRWRKYNSIKKSRQQARSLEDFQLLLTKYSVYHTSFLISLVLSLGYIILFNSNFYYVIVSCIPLFILEIFYLNKDIEVKDAKERIDKLKSFKKLY